MDPKRFTRAQICLYRAGVGILGCGLGGSLWAYWKAASSPEQPEVVPGVQDTKLDQYRMELYGGKANILANDLESWFSSLWHGRQLAFTLAILAIVFGLACFLLADFLPNIPPFPTENDVRTRAERNHDPKP